MFTRSSLVFRSEKEKIKRRRFRYEVVGKRYDVKGSRYEVTGNRYEIEVFYYLITTTSYLLPNNFYLLPHNYYLIPTSFLNILPLCIENHWAKQQIYVKINDRLW